MSLPCDVGICPAHLPGGRFEGCPMGTGAVGLSGSAGDELDRIALRCAPVASWLTSTAGITTTRARGGTGGTAFTDTCPVAFVLDAVTLRAGDRIDAITGRCQ